MTIKYIQTTPIFKPPGASSRAESRFSPNNATGSKSGYKNISVPPTPNTIIPSNRASSTKRFSNPSNQLPSALVNGIHPSMSQALIDFVRQGSKRETTGGDESADITSDLGEVA